MTAMNTAVAVTTIVILCKFEAIITTFILHDLKWNTQRTGEPTTSTPQGRVVLNSTSIQRFSSLLDVLSASFFFVVILIHDISSYFCSVLS